MIITFIGGGNMAKALISGMLRKGFAADAIRVVDISDENRQQIKQDYNIKTFSDLAPAIDGSDIVILAVKPQQLHEVASQLAPLLKEQLVISIAAGIRSNDLSRWLGGFSLVVRVMPNTPAMVMQGVSGMYALPSVSAEQKQKAEGILQAVGSTLWVEDEHHMDTITAISGSGPAYVFYFIEALEEAAIQLGLDAKQARQLSLETFFGASLLASKSDEDIATLRARVTSKGGTTERALHTMEAATVKRHIIEAIQSAAERSRELGDELGKK